MLTFPALRISQPLGEFYVVAMPAHQLLELTYSDPLKLVGINTDGSYELRGHQRKLIQERLQAIGRYIDTVEAAFPNSIILAANYHSSGELEESEDIRWSVDFQDGAHCGTLRIPTAEKLAAVIDGQHRLYGFTKCSERSRLEMPLLCAVYLDLPNPYQAYLFATINYNQRPVDKSQSYELYGFELEDEAPEAWSPEKAAVYYCRRLNTDNESVLKNHITIAAQVDETLSVISQERRTEWAVSTATIVEGSLSLFSANAKRDRDKMHRWPIGGGRNRKVLDSERDSTPLRSAFLEGNDQLIYTLIRNYFVGVSQALWNKDDPGFVRKTVGIQALFSVLKTICPEALEAKDISAEHFGNSLSRASHIDFKDDFFHASGAGKTRVKNVLELALGIKTLNDVSEDDRTKYGRLVAP